MNRDNTLPSKTLLATAALMALLSMQRANAQDAPKPPEAAASQPAAKPARVDDETKGTQVETVIVTGTARREGLRKLEASFSITTADEEQIKRAAPTSTADLLKIVPGVFVETTGGQSGANMRVRGFPTPGDGPYSTFQLNGSPLYALPTLSFFEHSQLFRLDDTIDRVEVLRGGPSPILSSGQPGITVNFIQKKGGAVPEGGLRVSTGTGGLKRVDGVYSGPLGDKWSVMVGGFFRTSNGVRDTEFPADRGGQFSGMLTRKLDDGELSVYARAMDEKNAFFTAIPVVSSADGKSVTAYPGFDPLRATFFGNELRHIVLETGRSTALPGGGVSIQREFVERDLADGRGAKVKTYGAMLDTKLGGWALSNKLNYTAGSVPTYALFSGASPQTLDAYIQSLPGGSTPAGTANGTASYVNGGGAITDLSLPVIVNGMWVVDKQMQSFTNETRLSRDIGKDHTLTLGAYLADYSSHDRWYLGQAQLMTVQPHARLVDVTLNNGDLASRNGYVTPPFSFNLDGRYHGTTTAVYVSDEWKAMDKLRIDGGLRYEWQRITGSIADTANGDLDGDPRTLYNNNLSYFTGSTSQLVPGGVSRIGKLSATLGANYNFSREFSIFARVNKGHRLPDFDILRGRGSDPTSPVEEISQLEVGLKTATPLYTAFLTAYHNRLKNSQSTSVRQVGSQFSRDDSKATGVEFEAAIRPLRGLEFALTGNLQDAKYTGNGTNAGNVVERQPKVQFRFTPSYKLPTDYGDFRVFGTWTHVGERFAASTNALKLPAYNTLDAGLVAHLANGIDVRLTGTNLTNEVGLTEGNFRVPNAAIGSDGVFLARPLFGRTWELSVGFVF